MGAHLIVGYERERRHPEWPGSLQERAPDVRRRVLVRVSKRDLSAETGWRRGVGEAM